MATTEADCIAIYEAVMRNKVMLAVCHVLRYTPYMSLMRELIEDGAVGGVMNRAANSGGPRGPTRPLDTPSRTLFDPPQIGNVP